MSMTDTSNKRYIITAPPSDFILLPSDLVFVLMQFDHGTEYQPLLAGGTSRLMFVDHSRIVLLGCSGSADEKPKDRSTLGPLRGPAGPAPGGGVEKAGSSS